jgi:surfactin synthase thioesterase subunit
VFHRWAGELPAWIEVRAVQLPGRANRLLEAPFVRLRPLVETLARELASDLRGSYALFGHSMGALISFELARELRRQNGHGPSRLFVSGYRAPHLPDREPPIHHLPGAEFVEELRLLAGTPGEVLENPELRQLLLPALRADFAMCETYEYVPEGPFECPIVAFGGQDDRKVSGEELSGWREHTHSAFRLRMLPGGHFFLHSARAALLEDVAQELTRAGGRDANAVDQ